MFDVILIPTDGSACAEAATERGLELAAAHDATVYVLCVADTGLLADVQLPGEHASAETAIHEEARRILQRVADRATAHGVDATTALREGPAKNEIVAYAETVAADVIVMGTHGRGGLERVVLGSVTEHVLRASDVDVFVTGEASPR